MILSALAVAAVLPTCSWDRPGANPFMGDVVTAVDRYKDIPEPTRQALKEKMRNRQYDEIVLIKRDSIEGKSVYSSQIYDMHFGNGSVCSTVTRNKWADVHQERGLVYCIGNECILVPTVCRNVSRIRKPAASKTAETPLMFEPPAAGASTVEDQPLSFEPPAAGPVSLVTAPQTFSEAVAPPLPRQVSFVPLSGFPVVVTTPPLPPGTVPAIPEPASYLLFVSGLSLICIRKLYVRKNSVV